MRKRPRTQGIASSPSSKHARRLQKFGSSRTEADPIEQVAGPVVQMILDFNHLLKQPAALTTASHDSMLNSKARALLMYLRGDSSGGDGEDDDIKAGTKDRQQQQQVYKYLPKQDVASILIPWSIKLLTQRQQQQQQSEDEVDQVLIAWQILDEFLTSFLRPHANHQLQEETDVVEIPQHVSHILTQKVLNKIVPAALHLALDPTATTADGSLLQQVAATCYCDLLKHLYHPTFEHACQTLLPAVRTYLDAREAIALRATNEHGMSSTHQVILATMQLLSERQQKSNTKKSFLLLSTFTLLTTFTRIMEHAKAGSESDADGTLHQLVQGILFRGLFTNEHLDAFRSIKSITSYSPVQSAKAPELSSAPERMDVDVDVDVTSLDESTTTQNKRNATDATTAAAKKSKTYRCYQEALLDTLIEGLNVTTTSTSNDAAVRATCKAIPLILQAMIQCSIQQEASKKVKGSRRKRTNELAKFQFGFFARLASLLLETIVDTSSATHVKAKLVALERCLDLLLQHDVYLPSNVGKDQSQYDYLQSVTSCVIQIKRSSIAFLVLRSLTRLNHLLVHDRLDEVLTLVVTTQKDASAPNKSTSALQGDATSWFLHAIETYQKLRQLDHFYRAMITCIERFGSENDHSTELSNFELMVLHPAFVASVGYAIQESPGFQTLEIFQRLDKWLQDSFVGGTDANSKIGSKQAPGTNIVIHLLCLILKHITVGKRNSHTISEQCSSTMESIVLKLVSQQDNGSSKSANASSNLGLQLACALLDLQLRCAFWTDSGDPTETNKLHFKSFIPDDLIRMLNASMDQFSHTAVGEHEDRDIDEQDTTCLELVALALQRIQHLYSIIHEMERSEAASASIDSGSTDANDEAERLVHFVFAVAVRQQTKGSESDCWNRIIQFLPILSKWANPDSIASFLRWFWSSLVGSPGDSAAAMATRALINDSALYENAAVSKRLGVSCLEFVDHELQAFFHGDWEGGKIARRSKSSSRFSSEHARNDGLDAIVGSLKDPQLSLQTLASRQDEAVARLNVISNAVSTVQRLPDIVWELTPIIPSIGMLLQINKYNRWLFKSKAKNVICTAPQISTMLNLIVSKVLDQFQQGNGDENDSADHVIHAVLLPLVDKSIASSIVVAQQHKVIPGRQIQAHLGAVGACVASIVTFVTQHAKAEETAETALIQIKGALCKNLNSRHDAKASAGFTSVDLAVHCVLFRSILKQSVGTIPATSDEAASTGRSIVPMLLGLIESHLWTHVVQCFVTNKDTSVNANADEDANANADGAIDAHCWSQCALLIADVLRSSIKHSGGVPAWLQQHTKDTVINTMIQHTTRISSHQQTKHGSNHGSNHGNMNMYLLACAALAHPSKAQRDGIIDCILNTRIRNSNSADPLVEATFLSTVGWMESDELTSIIDMLVDNHKRGSMATRCDGSLRLRLYSLLLRGGTNIPAEVLAIRARHMFVQALELMVSCSTDSATSGKQSEYLSACTHVVVDLSKRRDVVPLRERDIALVLGHISAVLQTNEPSLLLMQRAGSQREGANAKHNHQTYTGSTKTNGVVTNASPYNQCFFLLSTFLQRFSRQIYGCIPVAIKAMMGMLRHTLYNRADRLEAASRGQKFTRLCELLLPHKDVYKKHIICLLLEFVDALSNDLVQHLKIALTPAMYCLLDMLSEFESRQLNVMMDTTQRILFRSFHQNYQKGHAYKGQ